MHAHRARLRAAALAFAALAPAVMPAATFAAEPTSAQTLRLTIASATLRADPPVQKSGRFALRATLTSPDAALAAPVLEGGGFALTASADSASLVCYNDTIFRDDFDGDGF